MERRGVGDRMTGSAVIRPTQRALRPVAAASGAALAAWGGWSSPLADSRGSADSGASRSAADADNTALGSWCLARPCGGDTGASPSHRLLGGLAAMLGLATLFQYLFQSDLGIDDLLSRPYIATGVSDPGRMPPTVHSL